METRLQLFERPNTNFGFRWFENHRRSWSEIQTRAIEKYGANEFWHWTGDGDFGFSISSQPTGKLMQFTTGLLV